MSIAKPQNRQEFRQYVLTKLGAPVIEINVAEEQIDIAIEDAFQYFNERSHFFGTERQYLTFKMTSEFLEAFSSYRVQETSQQGSPNAKEPIPGRPTVYGVGLVEELTLVTPGKNYPQTYYPNVDVVANTESGDLPVTTQDGNQLATNPDENLFVYETTGDGKGTGLTVNIGPQRTTTNGITTVTVYNTGSGYAVGDIVEISGGTGALFEVSKVKTESPAFGNAAIQTQNNYLVLPDDVVGVTNILRSLRTDLVGIFPGGSVFPMLLGGIMGNDYACGNMGYDLVSYVAMKEYMATLEFLFFPPVQYNFNQRTHRLFLDTNNFARGMGGFGASNMGAYMCIECMVKPSPDVYPDLWNDLWMKEYAVALVKCQWGRNLTKYQQVNLPGGITMNGDQILSMGREDLKALKDRFSMDWADPPLDAVG